MLFSDLHFTITDEPFALAYMSCPSRDLAKRMGAGLLKAAEEMPIAIEPRWRLAALEPGAWKSMSVNRNSARLNVNEELIKAKMEAATDPAAKAQYAFIAGYFADRDPRQMTKEDYTENEVKLIDGRVLWGGERTGHCNLDFGTFVSAGTRGLRANIGQYRLRYPEAAQWYDGLEYCLDALDALARRYQSLAEEKARIKDENQHIYERIAETLKRIPMEPAWDFFSAMQSMALLYTFQGADAPGGFDQYMGEFFDSSDPKERWETLEGFWELMRDYDGVYNLCVGGSDENWNDTTNALSYAILEMNRQKVYISPNLTLRWCRNTSDDFLRAAAHCLKNGNGTPALYNDEAVCAALEKQGIPPRDSHLYAMNGCNQIEIQGKSHMGLEDGEICLLKLLEFALFDGMDLRTGDVVAVRTGDATRFAAYDALWEAFKKQVDFAVDATTSLANRTQAIMATYTPDPLRSLATQGCIESGKDYLCGGPIYNHGQILTEGLADTADSLTAIRHFVYDTKEISMETLLDALKKDFADYEPLRAKLENYSAKFGNDIDEADRTAADIQKYLFTALSKRHTWRDPIGGQYGGGLSTFQRTARYGRAAAAAANGRRLGDVFIADSIGATPGRDRLGPTAALCSALKYDHTLATSGFVMQLKFDKAMFSTEEGIENFITLVKGYFRGGGQQLTVNVVDQEALLDAKKHPERHQNLIVRVGGYSAYFTQLEEALQDNIIARTMHDV